MKHIQYHTLFYCFRLLSAAALSTTGDILEMGTGDFSTPMLHDIVSQVHWHCLLNEAVEAILTVSRPIVLVMIIWHCAPSHLQPGCWWARTLTSAGCSSSSATWRSITSWWGFLSMMMGVTVVAGLEDSQSWVQTVWAEWGQFRRI